MDKDKNTKNHTLSISPASFLHKWIAGSGGDSTVILSITGDLDVALVSPLFTPGILYEPIIFTSFIFSISNYQNSVIQIIARTFGLIINAYTRIKYVYTF